MAAVSVLIAVLRGLLWVLIGLLALLLVLVLLALFLPLDIRLHLDSDWAAPAWEEEMTGGIRWALRLRWGEFVMDSRWEGRLLTLISAKVRFFGIRRPQGRIRAQVGVERARAPRHRRSLPDIPLLLELVKEAAQFAGRLTKKSHIQISGSVTYGFPDPDITGWCEVYRGLITQVPVHLAADFSISGLIGWLEVDGRLSGYRLATAAWPALDNPVIRNRLAQIVRFRPIQNWLTRGGRRNGERVHVYSD